MFTLSLLQKYAFNEENKGLKQVGLFKGDGHDIDFATFLETDEKLHIRETFNKKLFTVGNTDQSYRLINHWAEMGLIDDDPKSREQGWRRFSALEVVWIHIVTELRRFGFPLSKIRIAKDFVFQLPLKNGEHLPEFEFYLSCALSRSPVYLVVFESGACEFALRIELEANQAFFAEYLPSYLVIDINKIVQKIPIWKNVQVKQHYSPELMGIRQDEMAVLIAIREGNFESVRIRFKNGKMDLFEGTETVDAHKRVIEVLREGKYQHIEVRQESGKVVSVKRTVKQKVKV